MPPGRSTTSRPRPARSGGAITSRRRPTGRARRKTRTRTDRLSYADATHRPLNSLMLILPFLLLFHIGAHRWGIEFIPHEDLRLALAFWGAGAPFLPPLLIVTVLALQHYATRDGWVVQWKVLAGMVGEGLLWTLPLVAISLLRGATVASVHPLSHKPVLQRMVYVFGAGVYEEFLFRLVFIGVVMLVFVDLLKLREQPVLVGAILLSAVAFSAYHFWPAGMPWDTGRFIFLATAGVLWGTVYAYRGFGVAVISHISWSLLATLR